MNKKVDFMIIGAMKSGTTSLARDLSMHPDIGFSLNKEPGYFSGEADWRKKLGQYHALFNEATADQLWGEASTQYTMQPEYPNTHQRIFEYNPKLKLIYIMRDPVRRIESNFAHNFVRKRVTDGIREEIDKNPSYLTRSKYYYQLKPYLDLFGKDQIHLMVFEQYIRFPNECLIELSEFLEIDKAYYKTYTAKHKNASAGRKILADGGIGRIFSPLKKYRHHLPDFMVRAGLHLFGNEMKNTPELPADMKLKLWKELEGDRLELEKLMGRSIPEWGIYAES